MEKFIKYEGKIVSIMNDNIDTDILIPKQYLKSVRRTGFGEYVFAPWRYDENGNKVNSFVLNQDEYKDSSILITGENFGCGSSREHAAWALQDFGIKVVIAGGYSDIFYNNWLNNGNVAIKIDRRTREFLAKEHKIIIDLENQKIIAGEKEFTFDFPEVYKKRLIEGTDSIDLTLKYEQEISKYENK